MSDDMTKTGSDRGSGPSRAPGGLSPLFQVSLLLLLGIIAILLTMNLITKGRREPQLMATQQAVGQGYPAAPPPSQVGVLADPPPAGPPATQPPPYQTGTSGPQPKQPSHPVKVQQAPKPGSALGGKATTGINAPTLPPPEPVVTLSPTVPPAAGTTPTPATPLGAPPADQPPAEPYAPKHREVLVPAGTVLAVRLVQALSSDRNLPGSTFLATLEYPLVMEGVVIADRHERVEGLVTESQKAGKVSGVSALALRLVRLRTKDGKLVEITTVPRVWVGSKSVGQDAATIGGLAALGALIGGLAGGGKEAAIGAAAGAGAGTAATLATSGKPIRLSSEALLEFRLRESIVIPIDPQK